MEDYDKTGSLVGVDLNSGKPLAAAVEGIVHSVSSHTERSIRFDVGWFRDLGQLLR